MLITGQSDFACDLLRAFGEDPNKTRGFTLRVYVNSVVTVEIEKYVDSETGLTEIIKKYAWVDEKAIEPQITRDNPRARAEPAERTK